MTVLLFRPSIFGLNVGVLGAYKAYIAVYISYVNYTFVGWFDMLCLVHFLWYAVYYLSLITVVCNYTWLVCDIYLMALGLIIARFIRPVLTLFNNITHAFEKQVKLLIVLTGFTEAGVFVIPNTASIVPLLKQCLYCCWWHHKRTVDIVNRRIAGSDHLNSIGTGFLATVL